MIRIRFTVNERMLAMVQNAGRNLKRQRLGSGAAAEEIVGGAGGVDTGVRERSAPFRGGSLAWIDSSVFPVINFFILLDSFGSEAGVVIRPPQS
jgi:hypothetical protein